MIIRSKKFEKQRKAYPEPEYCKRRSIGDSISPGYLRSLSKKQRKSLFHIVRREK